MTSSNALRSFSRPRLSRWRTASGESPISAATSAVLRQRSTIG